MEEPKLRPSRAGADRFAIGTLENIMTLAGVPLALDRFQEERASPAARLERLVFERDHYRRKLDGIATVFQGVLNALREGHGRESAWALSRVPSGYLTITGVAARAGMTALVTLAVDGDRRHLLDVTTASSDVDATIEDVRRRYRSEVVDRRGAEPEIDIATLADEMSAGRWVIPNVGPIERGTFDVLFEILHGEAGARLLALWCARPA
jgi:hypothetical protein